MCIRDRHFTWTTDFNISFNRSKVLRIDGDNEYYQTSVSGGTNSSVLYRAIVDVYKRQVIGDVELKKHGSVRLPGSVSTISLLRTTCLLYTSTHDRNESDS